MPWWAWLLIALGSLWGLIAVVTIAVVGFAGFWLAVRFWKEGELCGGLSG